MDPDTITGVWGEGERPLLELTADRAGVVTGIVYGYVDEECYTAPIGRGRFDAATNVLTLEGQARVGTAEPEDYYIVATLEDGRLEANYQFGEWCGTVTAIRIDDAARRD